MAEGEDTEKPAPKRRTNDRFTPKVEAKPLQWLRRMDPNATALQAELEFWTNYGSSDKPLNVDESEIERLRQMVADMKAKNSEKSE